LKVAFYTFREIRFRFLRFLLTSFLSITFFLMPLASSLVVREIFNGLENLTAIDLNIWTLVLIFTVIQVIMLVNDIVWVLFMFTYILSIRVLLRKNMITGVFKQHGAMNLPYTSGEAVSRFRKDADEAAYFPIAMSDLVSFFIFAIIAFYLMFSINASVTLFVFFPFTFIVIIIQMFRKKVTKYREERRKATGAVTSTIREIFNSIQSIKVVSAENEIINHFEDIIERRSKTVIKDEFLTAFLTGIRIFIIYFATSIMLVLIIHPMMNDEFRVGDFALFIFLLEWITDFISYLGETIARYHRTSVSFGRMSRLMRGNEESIPENDIVKHGKIYLSDPFPSITPLQRDGHPLDKIAVKNLSFKYPNSDKGIYDINLEIRKGTLNVITGRMGSGKTTLLQSMLGLLPKQKGSIYWNGNLIEDEREFLVPPRVAYTSQVPLSKHCTSANPL